MHRPSLVLKKKMAKRKETCYDIAQEKSGFSLKKKLLAGALGLGIFGSGIIAGLTGSYLTKKDYAQEIYQKLFDAGFQVELNDKSESMGKKARDAQIQRFNYLLTVGEKEQQENKIAVKAKDSKEIKTMTLEEFTKKLKNEISSKTL